MAFPRVSLRSNPGLPFVNASGVPKVNASGVPKVNAPGVQKLTPAAFRVFAESPLDDEVQFTPTGVVLAFL